MILPTPMPSIQVNKHTLHKQYARQGILKIMEINRISRRFNDDNSSP